MYILLEFVFKGRCVGLGGGEWCMKKGGGIFNAINVCYIFEI